VITRVEDLGDYKAFEATIIADYDPETAVERELVLRLASLLWRSRRAILIESGLFAIQAQNVRGRRQHWNARTSEPTSDHRFPRLIHNASGPGRANGSENGAQSAAQQHPRDRQPTRSNNPVECARLLTFTFLRLANLESGGLGLLNR